jgi:hypothetical protein
MTFLTDVPSSGCLLHPRKVRIPLFEMSPLQSVRVNMAALQSRNSKFSVIENVMYQAPLNISEEPYESDE